MKTQKYDFLGLELECIVIENEVFVPIKAVCDKFGLDYDYELDMINDHIVSSPNELMGPLGSEQLPFGDAIIWIFEMAHGNIRCENLEVFDKVWEEADKIVFDLLKSDYMKLAWKLVQHAVIKPI